MEEADKRTARLNYHKQYYKDNRDRLVEYRYKKFSCSLCGGKYTQSHLLGHTRTNRHQQAVKEQAGLSNTDPTVLATLALRLMRQPETDLAPILESIYKVSNEKPTCEVQQETNTPPGDGAGNQKRHRRRKQQVPGVEGHEGQ